MKGPTQISFDITKKCNFNCLHCYNNSGVENNDDLSDVEVENLILDIIEIKPCSFCFCGGEPLLRVELLIYMAELLSAAGINCSLVTNGYLLNKEIAKKIKKSKINIVQVSLDGDEESHDRLRNRKGAYKKAIEAISYLREANIEVGIAFSPTTWGISDFQHVYRVANQYSCHEIRVQELMPLGRGYLNRKIIPSNIQYRALRSILLEKEISYYLGDSKVKVVWGDPIDHLICLTEGKIENKYVAIRNNGDIVASMYIPIVLGNVKRLNLKTYWDNGIEAIWHNEEIIKVAKNFTSVRKMNPTNYKMPNIFLEPDIHLDLI